MKGSTIKEAIKQSGYTLEDAARMLKMTRQSLYNNLAKDEVTSGFLAKVKEVFGEKFGDEFFEEKSVMNESAAPYGTNLIALNRIIQLQEDNIKRLERELFECRQLTVNGREKAKSA